jgi:HSP20 family molecular chaperone IbpA
MEFVAGEKTGPAWYSGFSYMMNMNLVETIDEYQIFADAPGVAHRDISITHECSSITIKAKRRWYKGDDIKVHTRELPVGVVRRTVHLPSDADVANAHADIANGVIVVTCRKIEHSAI